MAFRVLLVQSDMRAAQPLTRYFKQRGDEVWQAWELGQAQALLEQVKPNLLLMDLHFASAGLEQFPAPGAQTLPGLEDHHDQQIPGSAA